MSVDIGPKIGIDGEAEFRKELNNINQQLKTLGSEMKAVTSAFEAGDNSQEALAAQSQVLTRQIEAQESKLEQLRKGLTAAAKEYGENDTRTLKWAQAVNDATADLNKMKAQLTKTEGGMDDLADATEEAGEAAEGAGSKFSVMTVAMGNLISSGIQAAVSAVTELMGAVLHLDETTEEYRAAQGKLNTAFEAAGYGPETAKQAYTEFYKILGETDTAAEASQLLAKLAQGQEDVATWTNIAAGVSGTFGDSLPIEGLIEAANETAKVGQVTGTLADALNWAGISEDGFNAQLAACSTESQRNQLIMDTLAGTYATASEAFYRNNEALVQARANQAALDASLSMLGGTIAELKNRIFSDFAPAVSQLIASFSDLLQGVDGADESFAQALGGLIQTGLEQLPGFLSVGVEIIAALVSGILDNVPALLTAGAELVASLVEAVLELLPKVLDAGVTLLDRFTTGIEEGLPDLVSRLPQVIDTILDFLTDNLPAILDQGVELLESLTDGILKTIPELVAALPEIITAFVDFIAENLPAILSAGVDILLHLTEGIIDAIPKLVDSLPKLITAVTSGLANLFPQIVQSGVTLTLKLWDGIFSAIPRLVGNLPQVIGAVVDGFDALMDGIVDVGWSIVEGLWAGIRSGAGWLLDKITGWANDILDSVTSAFGIHSPSAVFRDEVGRYLAQGIGVGFEREMDSVAARMQRAIPTPEVSFQRALSGLSGGVGASSFSQTLNFYGPEPISPAEAARQTRNAARALLKGVRA